MRADEEAHSTTRVVLWQGKQRLARARGPNGVQVGRVGGQTTREKVVVVERQVVDLETYLRHAEMRRQRARCRVKVTCSVGWKSRVKDAAGFAAP